MTVTVKGEFSFDAATLAAVKLAMAGKSDGRLALMGVCLSVHGDGAGFLVATDGHRLHAAKVEGAVSGGMGGAFTCLVPADTVAAAVKAAGKRGEIRLTIEGEIRDPMAAAGVFEGAITVDAGGGVEIRGQACDAGYPDWRRIVPTVYTDGEMVPAQYSPEYVADFGKASKLLGNKYGHATIHQAGNGAALVTVRGAANFFGVLMPYRYEAADSAIETGDGSAYAAVKGAAGENPLTETDEAAQAA